MKKIFITTLLFLMILSTSAFAMLRVVDSQTEARYLTIVQEEYGKDMKFIEGWIKEFYHLEKEVYVMFFITEKEKIMVYLDMETEGIISEEKFNEMVAEEEKANKDNPIFTITALKGTNDPDAPTSSDDEEQVPDGDVKITGKDGSIEVDLVATGERVSESNTKNLALTTIGIGALTGALVVLKLKKK
ncbi:hypothetical protein [Anaerobranca gottschalkii]|uniref:LPXTG-motif cell wall anchor domain-containing protein n=1 Tax=Anaerobranca gottschalkii DSM 13577 TaxID=1120990 RepID=A0A1I0ADJ7_9FIRM|nr:hypothetical protein [Anaerobranca gottschalkii]SES92155.1 hypothetical protein SAMN03080614_102017 [Anaerobranca gottschalkii DSM 13577]